MRVFEQVAGVPGNATAQWQLVHLASRRRRKNKAFHRAVSTGGNDRGVFHRRRGAFLYQLGDWASTQFIGLLCSFPTNPYEPIAWFIYIYIYM